MGDVIPLEKVMNHCIAFLQQLGGDGLRGKVILDENGVDEREKRGAQRKGLGGEVLRILYHATVTHRQHLAHQNASGSVPDVFHAR